MTTIGLVDHGAGNLVSAARALEVGGSDVKLIVAPWDLAGCDGLVVPGVGTTRAAMQRLSRQDLIEPLRQWQAPLLGICVGMQILFDFSTEDATECLGTMAGEVAQLPQAPRLPHIGWNDVELGADPLFDSLGGSALFYFVHSYAAQPLEPSAEIAWSSYGSRFVAAVRSGSRAGVQFHPERSGRRGLQVLSNFVAECREWRRAA